MYYIFVCFYVLHFWQFEWCYISLVWTNEIGWTWLWQSAAKTPYYSLNRHVFSLSLPHAGKRVSVHTGAYAALSHRLAASRFTLVSHTHWFPQSQTSRMDSSACPAVGVSGCTPDAYTFCTHTHSYLLLLSSDYEWFRITIIEVINNNCLSSIIIIAYHNCSWGFAWFIRQTTTSVCYFHNWPSHKFSVENAWDQLFKVNLGRKHAHK